MRGLRNWFSVDSKSFDPLRALLLRDKRERCCGSISAKKGYVIS